MSYIKNDDVRITSIEELLPPIALLEAYPASDVAAETVAKNPSSIHKILHGADDRLLVVIGPCSIHDPKAALEYAQKIKAMRADPKINQNLEVVMRVYFENPVQPLVGKA